MISEERGSHAVKWTTFEPLLVWEVRKGSFLKVSCFCCNLNNDLGLTGKRMGVLVGTIEGYSCEGYLGDKIIGLAEWI